MLGKMKKGLAISLSAALMVASLAGCGSKTTTTSSSSATSEEKNQDITLTLWGSQDDQSMLRELADNFIKTHTDNKYTITLGVCGEDVAKDTVLKDLDAAGDVFAFASDQLAALNTAGALMPITVDTAKVKKANTAASVQAATINGQLFAYPQTANTFFLYYDKKYLTDSDVKTMEGIMNKSVPSGVTNLAFNMTTGWYGASFFLSAGNQLFGPKGTDATKCDFSNAKGLSAGKYMIQLANQKSKFADYGTNFDSTIVQNFQARKLAAAVSGTWNATKIQAALGSDYGATKLPTISLDGKDTQMKSFSNFNLYGVNSHTKHAKAAMELAEYLSGEEGQKTAFSERSSTPTNIALSKDSSLLSSNLAVQACAQQTQSSVLQPSIDQISKFWDPMGALGTSIENGKTTDATLQTDLNNLVTSTLAKISQ